MKVIKNCILILLLSGCMHTTDSSYNKPIVNADTKNISINIKNTCEADGGCRFVGGLVLRIEFKNSYQYIHNVDIQEPNYQIYISTETYPDRKWEESSTCQEIAMWTLSLVPCWETTKTTFNVRIVKTSTNAEENFVFQSTRRIYSHIILLIPSILQGFYNLQHVDTAVIDQLLNEINMRIINMEND